MNIPKNPIRPLRRLGLSVAGQTPALIFATIFQYVWQGAADVTLFIVVAIFVVGFLLSWKRCFSADRDDFPCFFRSLKYAGLATIVCFALLELQVALGALLNPPSPTPTAVVPSATPFVVLTSTATPTIVSTSTLTPLPTATDICYGQLYDVDPPPGASYDVQPGDSLFSIADAFHISVADLVEGNVKYYPSLATNPNCISDQWVFVIPAQ